MIVLDTNIVSEASRQRPDSKVMAWLQGQPIGGLWLPAPVIDELFFGAERVRSASGSDRHVRAAARLRDESFAGRILSFDSQAASLCGVLRARRQAVGRPIALADAMIAAICLHNGATLATRNIRDFEGLDLSLVNPFEG